MERFRAQQTEKEFHKHKFSLNSKAAKIAQFDQNIRSDGEHGRAILYFAIRFE